MCNSHVMHVVHERVKKEGFSRRNFLRGGLAAAGLAASGSLLRPQPARAFFRQEMAGEIVDLSHVLGPNIPLYSLSDLQPTPETLVTVSANGFFKQKWTFDEHSSTHVDAPAHFVEGAETIDVYNPSGFVAPLVVIDISAKAAEDPDAMVTPDDLAAWEAANGEIPAGAFVAMYSGWDAKWGDIDAYRNADDSGTMHFPGFGGEAATWLVTERDIVGIGVDTLSQDIGASTTFDVHVTILSAGKYGVENLAGLGNVLGKPASIMIGIPRYAGGSGGPCRALAMV